MSRASRFIGACIRYGDVFTATSVTGTQCPCMISRDANNPTYSPAWHVNNPDADDCSGSGLIDTTSTTINLKGFLYPTALLGTSQVPDTIKSVIGETANTDLIVYGQVNTDTLAFYDMSGLTEYDDTITFDSVTYVDRKTFELKIQSTIAQVSLFKRKS